MQTEFGAQHQIDAGAPQGLFTCRSHGGILAFYLKSHSISMTLQSTSRLPGNESHSVLSGTDPLPLRRLRDLIRHATANSPYYSARLKGLEDRPLSELPILSKAEMMDHWDEIVCDARLKRSDLEHYVRQPPGPGLYLDQYRVLSTSGTSQREAVSAYSRREWTAILAGLSRGMRWLRQAPNGGCFVMIGAGAENRISMSQELCRAIKSFRPNTHFVDCRAPLLRVVKQLNTLQPSAITGYASILGVIAREQMAGRLRIEPQTINSSAEVCSPALKARIEEAFGVAVDETYTIGEAGVIAANCYRRDGMHVMTEDIILECVDSAGAPVAPGHFGDQLLVTVLRSRTLPLIRYAVPDRVRFALQPCECGLPGPVIESVEGRAAEVLEVAGRDGREPVLLSVWGFDRGLQLLGITLWQLALEPDGIVLRVQSDHSRGDREAARTCVESVLRQAGSDIHVRVVADETLKLGPAGKLGRLTILPSTKELVGADAACAGLGWSGTHGMLSHGCDRG